MYMYVFFLIFIIIVVIFIYCFGVFVKCVIWDDVGDDIDFKIIKIF